MTSRKQRHRDHTGEKYGMLTVEKDLGSGGSNEGIRWLCRCKCGGTRIIYAKNLKYARDCGCRKARRMGDPPAVNQPCWSCEKYAGRCSWSKKNPEPVKGWDAVPTVKYQGRHDEMKSFAIFHCPEYVSDGTEGRL